MTCKDCKAMKVLDEFQRRLYREEEILEALDGAIRFVEANDSGKAKSASPKATLATSTCLQPGCSNYIKYDPNAATRPLYCKKHMGAHRGRNEIRIRKVEG